MPGRGGTRPDATHADEREDDVFAARAKVTPEQARRLLEAGDYDLGDHPRITPTADGMGSLDLFVTRAQVASLEAAEIAIELGENQSARARQRIAEFTEGDRYEGGRQVPHGIGRKIGGSQSDKRPDNGAEERGA